MPKFSEESIKKLVTCDSRLQLVAKEAIKQVDFKIICGFRDIHEQDKAFKEGNSLKKGGESRHNLYPSMAFDFIPYPFTEDDWKNIHKFTYVAGIIMATGYKLGVRLRYGGDFDMDGSIEGGWDWGHIEILGN